MKRRRFTKKAQRQFVTDGDQFLCLRRAKDTLSFTFKDHCKRSRFGSEGLFLAISPNVDHLGDSSVRLSLPFSVIFAVSPWAKEGSTNAEKIKHSMII